jgi:hypothetical protein
MATIPDGAACYFCLGEEADDEGMPLVRDCSCRGDSAGFVHLPCLVKYAEQKCKGAGDGEIAQFREPWHKCNNCKQPFQNQLSMDLASAFVSFAEATYGHSDSSNKWDKLRVMDSLRIKLGAFTDTSNEVIKVERESTINHLLSMVDQTKKDLNMSKWIHMPKGSDEYEYYKMLCVNYEAYTYHDLANMCLSDSSQEGVKLAITHLKKARAICNLLDMKDAAKNINTLILLHTDEQATNQQLVSSEAALQFVSTEAAAASAVLQNLKQLYEHSLNTNGMNSELTILTGYGYASLLWDLSHHLEAERLAIKVATASCQVHGPNHKSTIDADDLRQKCTSRCVFVDDKLFQAIQYENDGETCLITGPVADERILEEQISNGLLI